MVSNLLGLAGLALVIAAVAALTGPWWAVLAAGAALLGIAYSLHTWEARPTPTGPATARPGRRAA